MVSNDKAAVSKELNEKHRKILEGLLKLPENRECADCKSRGPRWASVNLGIFVCIQCSGIHRSLGVHISKVRSATLDTWLPEQVAFIQSMGNAKANSYWEAELPPNYDRVGIENFIRAKYEEKRWIPRTSKSTLMIRDDKYLAVEKKGSKLKYEHDSVPGEHAGHHSDSKNAHDSGKPIFHTSKTHVPAIPAPRRSSQNLESEAADLFHLLTVEESKETNSSSSADDENSWAAFQSAEPEESSEALEQKNSQEPKNSAISVLEDLFAPSTPANENAIQVENQMPVQSQPTLPSSSQIQTQTISLLQPQKDAKKDIMSLFEQSTMSSPFSLHQQQMAALLAQQQSILMAAAAASSGQQTPIFSQQQLQSTPTKSVNGSGVTVDQTWQNVSRQGLGLFNTFGTQMGVQLSGQAGAFLQSQLSQSQGSIGAQSFGNTGISGFAMPYSSDSSKNGPTSLTGKATVKPSVPVASSSNPSSGASYDFSSLLAGELSKR
eukprot:TRINITY_DN7682_c0_g1_i1.p1 TRINITY_DN7682_c0_g1~~TRINITY_DN7682_c0_g1_i1.p1  ORF type:complete len:492 (+),score=123.37 TRINITY_DN7682_c0_g1_i1:180-1655(+)